MNKQESDILNTLLLEPFINQRVLAEVSGHSLGVVNCSLKELIKAGYLNEAICPIAKAVVEYKNKTPKRAIILAAGFGMRMVPINTEMPKDLLKVSRRSMWWGPLAKKRGRICGRSFSPSLPVISFIL